MKMILFSLLALILALTCCSLTGCGSTDEIEEGEAAETNETNPCAGKKLVEGWENTDCLDDDGIVVVPEQSGTNVTVGYKGDLETNATPITTNYSVAGLCPVNVHWHLGAEHLSAGEYDGDGKGPANRRLAEDARRGFRCHHYEENSTKFDTEYEWEYCVGMHVGETYEVHWPHSSMGDCNTKWQYQTPFYDGVFCHIDKLTTTYESIGVQAQIFTIVNDESNTYDDLFDGMWVDGTHGVDVAKYTGSTTGTSRNNEMCSKYTPITWQVDRACHLISASSFDKMCKKMMETGGDDMTHDLYAHGARELVIKMLAADNHQRL